MNWISVSRYLPGVGSGYVIARVVNIDECDFVYMAIYSGGKWEFWDQEYWPDNYDRKFKVTHWTHMPELGE